MTNRSVTPAEPRFQQTAHYGDTQGEAGQEAPGSLSDQQCRCSQARIGATSIGTLVIALECGEQRSIANSRARKKLPVVLPSGIVLAPTSSMAYYTAHTA
jgi:hypothetical protein